MTDLSSLPELNHLIAGPLRLLEPLEQEIFCQRVAQQWEDVLRPLTQLYADHPNFNNWLNQLLRLSAQAYAKRSHQLRLLDLQRLNEPDWFQQANMVGYICYVDRFAGDLQGIVDKIPYLKELGITYLHLMPLLKPRKGENDGGYAVADYREVDPCLGTMEELAELTSQLRASGISLCTDLVCNHTAVEHPWAKHARTGDTNYQDYYFMFPDRTLPDQYEQNLRDIFPTFKPGNFIYHADIDKWVWTTFHEYQWDLNYHNPAVFAEMLDVMLFLANQGVEILRMDAVAFMWKEMGTNCENLPQAHLLLQAWRALTRLAAPGLILKAEAIVSPDDVVPYLGTGIASGKECELAYHNSLMVLLWSALAERDVRLTTYSLQQLPELPTSAAWVTYVRCHDDIGWAITDENAGAIGLSGFAHRAFLSDFYSGQFEESFARGAIFQLNEETGDRRISGSCASLAGLELGAAPPRLAIQRILLLHSMIFAYGGIPLLYMGDEIGLLNDYDYEQDIAHKGDNRWLHRPQMDWETVKNRNVMQTVAGQLFQGIKRLTAVRKQTPALHAQATVEPIWIHNDHILAILRHSPRGRVLILGNFTETWQAVPTYRLAELGFSGTVKDQISQETYATEAGIPLAPYQSLWLTI